MLFDFIFNAYRYSVPIVLLSYFLVSKENKVWLLNVIATSNFLVIIYCCSNVAYQVEVIKSFYERPEYEKYNFGYSRTNMFSPYGWLFYVNTLALILPFLFLFKKLRVKFWLVIIEIILLWSEEIWLILTNFYRDYLPSSWSVYYTNSSNVFMVLNYTCLFIAAYALLWLLKVLPSQYKKFK